MHFPSDLIGIVVYIIGLFILWIVVSIPVYFAGKAVKGRNASLGEAMGATLGGVLAYTIVVFVAAFFLGAVMGPAAGVLAVILGLLAWLAVFRAAFNTTWFGAIGIVILAWIILLILDLLLAAISLTVFPDFFPF